jgi:hypothetical protein
LSRPHHPSPGRHHLSLILHTMAQVAASHTGLVISSHLSTPSCCFLWKTSTVLTWLVKSCTIWPMPALPTASLVT